MFEIRPASFDSGSFDRPARPNHAVVLNQAINLFNQSRWNSLLEWVKSAVLRRTCFLLDLESLPQNCMRNQRYGGIKPIRIDRICGSLGRTGDFDNHFHPLDDRIRDRWVSIAMARKQNIPLAPVELIQVGDRYFVKDGHHRISVARALGESAIDAEVIIWELTGSLPRETQATACILPQIA